jgi:hypothetical protein
LIISVRGTSGSGKSTIVRKLLALGYQDGAPILGMLGVRAPEAYLVELPDGGDLFVLGPYVAPTGGMDAVVGHGGIPACLQLLDKYEGKGHVVFEGLILSSMWGSVGRWLEARKDKVIIAPISASLEECQAGLASRGKSRGDKTQKFHYEGTIRVCEQAKANGMRVEPLHRERAVEQIMGWLKS